MSTEAHDRMIAAFQEYFKWQTRFDEKQTDESGAKTRYWLRQIRTEAAIRQAEIQEIRAKKKEIRNGRMGRPPKITNE